MADNLFNLNNPDFLGIMMRFLINLFFLFILIRVVYFRYSKKEKYLFAFFLIGIVIFFVGSMLKAVFLEFGMAIGLFAVFTILNFRTRTFNIKDMAYIFTVIALSAVNSFKLVGFPVLGVLIFNVIIIVSAYILEQYLLKNKSDKHSIIYENLKMLKPENRQDLIRDVSERTGQHIIKIKIRRINFKEKFAVLDIFFKV
jgi:signal transduction histidine kinase